MTRKFNAESILALKDEPLKKDRAATKLGNGKENLKSNLMQTNYLNDNFLLNLKESNKKKYKRSVLRREAEQSHPRNDDLLWNPSNISISSLPQIQSGIPKITDQMHQQKPNLEIPQSQNMNRNSNGNQGIHLMNINSNLKYPQSSNSITLGFIDEVIEICAALNRRPVKAGPIERLSRLESRPDFNFRSLVESNCSTANSICLKLTSSLALAASELTKNTFTQNGEIIMSDQVLRELNALLSSIKILNKVFMEASEEKMDQDKMINLDSLKELVKTCSNRLNNNKKDIRKDIYNGIKRNIKEEVHLLQDKIHEFRTPIEKKEIFEIEISNNSI